jgi:hypothetical protein
MSVIKNFEDFVSDSHGMDKELENARMMRGSAEGLTSWAERKIAESKPENFKEGIINPLQEELTLPINENPTNKKLKLEDEDEEDPYNPSIINKDAAKTAGGNVAYHEMTEGGMGDNQVAGQPVFTQHVDKSKQGYQDAMYYEEDIEDEEE